MENFWYIILMVMLTVYIVLDGYDFGVGIIHLFFAKNEKDKKILKNSIGPFWDANEVWLVAGGGILFFAFPKLYASSFSGFYLPLIMILWLLIFRGIGIEFRNQISNTIWQTIWDKAFGVSSLLLALFFGLALGNVVRGVNLGGIIDGVSTFEPTYFFIPLWNSTFSPLSEQQGIIDWFTILLGLVSLTSITIHGANWIIYRTNSLLVPKLKKIIFRLNFVLLFLVLISLLVWHLIRIQPFKNFNEHILLWIFPIITFGSIILLFNIKNFKKDGIPFLLSTLFLVSAFASTAIALFPELLPSTNTINPSLTIYNASANKYGLTVGSRWWIIAFILVIIYLIIQFKIFKPKKDIEIYPHE